MKKLFFLFLLCSCFWASAQNQLWEKTYGGEQVEFLYDALPTTDYGFILAGSSLSGASKDKQDATNGNLDYWVWKMNEYGELDWQKCFGGSGRDQLISIQLTHDGGFILAGSSDSSLLEDKTKNGNKKEKCFGMEDFWIIKLNAKGEEEWQKTFGGNGQDNLVQVVATKDGGYLLGGVSNSDASGNKDSENFGGMDYWLLKTDSKGKIEWQHNYGGIFNDNLKSVLQTKNGNYLIGGTSNSPYSGNKTEENKGGNDIWLLLLDPDGTLLWQKSIGNEYENQLGALVEDQDQNIILGATISDKNRKKDMQIAKLSKDGMLIWQKEYDINDQDNLSALVVEKDNSIVVGGFTYQNTKEINTKSDFVLFKIDTDGQTLWQHQQESSQEDRLQKIIGLRDGGYLLAGTRKFPSNGGVDATGGRGGFGGNTSDFYVTKNKDNHRDLAEKTNIEAMPNPAVTFTNIVLGFDYATGTATLFDLNGRQISTQTIEKTRTIPIDLSALPAGIYLIEVETNTEKGSVKIMKK